MKKVLAILLATMFATVSFADGMKTSTPAATTTTTAPATTDGGTTMMDSTKKMEHHKKHQRHHHHKTKRDVEAVPSTATSGK